MTQPTDTVLAARQLRREQLAVLLSRAARGVLTPAEGPLLRANVETELADANTAYLELDNQRETFDIAYDALAARAERAEQQLAHVRRVARNYPGLRHLHAALDGTQQPECTGCGDTGACNGGPCAHPDAQQPSPDGVPQHAARGTNAEDCPACCAGVASGSAPSYPWLCPGPAPEESTRHDRPVQHCEDPTPHPPHPNDLLHPGTRCPGTDHGTTGRTTP